MASKTNYCLYGGVLFLLIILGTLTIKESFVSGGDFQGVFPESVTKSLLAPPFGNYNMKQKGVCAPGLSNYTYEIASKLDAPSYGGSYCQVTNNKRYWGSPCNGTSIPAETCGGLYKRKKIIKPKALKAPPNSPQQGVRVNYYVSEF